VAEGRYAGAIPILNDIPGNREVVKDGANGIILPNFTSTNLARLLSETVENLAALKARFGPVNRKWIEQHSLLEDSAQEFLSLGEAVLSDAS
jgi:glycosyltransferase involved in cell wall biosynthesis